MIKLDTPQFASEAEEAQWWFDHDDEIAGHFEKALQNGTLTRGTALRRLGLAATNIILDVQDADWHEPKQLSEAWNTRRTLNSSSTRP